MSRSLGSSRTRWLEVYHVQMLAMREVAQAALDSFDRMERVLFRAANEALAEQTAIADKLPEAVDDEGTNTLLAHFQPSTEHLMNMQRAIADELSANWSDFSARVTGACGQYAQAVGQVMGGDAMTPWMSTTAPIEPADAGAAVQPLTAIEDAFKQWQGYAQQAMHMAQQAFEQAQAALPPGAEVPAVAARASSKASKARARTPKPHASAARKSARKPDHKSA